MIFMERSHLIELDIFTEVMEAPGVQIICIHLQMTMVRACARAQSNGDRHWETKVE